MKDISAQDIIYLIVKMHISMWYYQADLTRVFGYMLLRGVMWPRLSCFFYTKYRRLHARSIVFERGRLVQNLDQNLPIFKIASLKNPKTWWVVVVKCEVLESSVSLLIKFNLFISLWFTKSSPKSGAISIKNQFS